MHCNILNPIAITLLALASPAVAQHGHATPEARVGSARAAAAEEGWPDTRAGALARGWVTAFSTGEAAMKKFLATELAPKSLQSKSVPQRIERYRNLREKYGRLELASVVKSTPGELTVKLLSSDAKVTEFVFAVQTEAPFKLVSVAMKENHFGHGGGSGFGH